ncbi:hypothetical protein, partial [Salmonella enterica]|uniref:hypothetical protein n=1 Tax=Salmonella enterica TaxID=28901 RepID=UPI0020C3C3A1
DLKYLGKTIELFRKRPELQYVNGSRFSKESDTKGRKWYRKITSLGLVFLLKTNFSHEGNGCPLRIYIFAEGGGRAAYQGEQ